MILFVLLIIVPASFVLEVLLVKWFFWALYDVGYLSHALTWSQSAEVALPVFVAGLIGALWSSS